METNSDEMKVDKNSVSNLDVTTFIKKWDKIIKKIKENSVIIAALMKDTKAYKYENNVLYIQFPDGNMYHSIQVMKPDKREIIEEIISNIFSENIKIETFLNKMEDDVENIFLKKSIDFFQGEVIEGNFK